MTNDRSEVEGGKEFDYKGAAWCILEGEGVMKPLGNLIVMVFTWLCAFVKTYRTVDQIMNIPAWKLKVNFENLDSKLEKELVLI